MGDKQVPGESKRGSQGWRGLLRPLPEVGSMVTGDALVTGHPISRTKGPQVLESMFQNDAKDNLASLELLAGYDAGMVLAGHGPLWHGPIAKAVAIASGKR